MKLDFTGKTVLVTGASRGIGEGIAAGFIEAGATVHILAEDDAVHDTARKLGATGHLADITNVNAVGGVLAGFTRLDVLVNNAGLERMTPITDPGSLDIFRRILDINITGTTIVTQAVLPLMPRGACIINTCSIWGRVAEAQFGAYVASKHAIAGLTKVWAKELGPRGIRVNAVAPGWVRTVASVRSAQLMAEREGTTLDEVFSGVEAAQALPGIMEPRDMASTYVFLASPLAANVTGQILNVDRGEVPW